MRAAKVLVAALLAAWAGGAAAQPPSNPPPQASRLRDSCFNARFVNGFAAPDEETVYVRVGAREVYRLKLAGGCLDVDWSMAVGLKSRDGSDWICQGYDADLIVPDRGMGPQRCPVSDVRKLTPAEVAALPKKARP